MSKNQRKADQLGENYLNPDSEKRNRMWLAAIRRKRRRIMKLFSQEQKELQIKVFQRKKIRGQLKDAGKCNKESNIVKNKSVEPTIQYPTQDPSQTEGEHCQSPCQNGRCNQDGQWPLGPVWDKWGFTTTLSEKSFNYLHTAKLSDSYDSSDLLYFSPTQGFKSSGHSKEATIMGQENENCC